MRAHEPSGPCDDAQVLRRCVNTLNFWHYFGRTCVEVPTQNGTRNGVVPGWVHIRCQSAQGRIPTPCAHAAVHAPATHRPECVHNTQNRAYTRCCGNVHISGVHVYMGRCVYNRNVVGTLPQEVYTHLHTCVHTLYSGYTVGTSIRNAHISSRCVRIVRIPMSMHVSTHTSRCLYACT